MASFKPMVGSGGASVASIASAELLAGEGSLVVSVARAVLIGLISWGVAYSLIRMLSARLSR